MTDAPILSVSDGTVYSKSKNIRPFSAHPLEDYSSIVSEEKIEKLQSLTQRLKGLKVLELNSTAEGGGVAEMLYSSIPFLNDLGIETEWKVINGHKAYYECTKHLHNLLQGMKGSFTREMKRIYLDNLIECAKHNIIDNSPDMVIIHDPQPMLLCRLLKKETEKWFWRCHIDIEPAVRSKNGLLTLLKDWVVDYDAAVFSAARYVFPPWPIPKFIIPPFIDPLSEKNRDLTDDEIAGVLVKYEIDLDVPIIAQIGRFDPWKGLNRTIDTYRQVRETKKCQLVIAGGFASDDPEGERIFEDIYSKTRGDEDIHLLRLSLANRLENFLEINALQRAATIIMQPSTREGFGLVVAEALWKGKPVIASQVGGISFQIKKGKTGYFYENQRKTAQKITHLLNNQKAAERVGERGRKYVQEHFLIIDIITDHLMSMDIIMNSALDKKKLAKCVTSFYSW
ncbi:glycosyltransferase [Chloroflexota bacterium]